MNLFKLLTKAGRQDLVREAAKECLTPNKIADLVAEGVARGLEAGAAAMGEDRCAQIALGCQMGGNALIHITAAVSPDGEEGMKVSAGEKQYIICDIRAALSSLLTQNAIDLAVESAVKLVP